MATWAEDRARVREMRPKRWLCGSDQPYVLNDFYMFGGTATTALTENQLALRIFQQGWPLVPCSLNCQRCASPDLTDSL